MRFFFYLSGEHPTLPRAEIFACLESANITYRNVFSLDQVVVVDIPKINGVIQRLALTHKICEFIFMCSCNEEEIIEEVNKEDFPDKTYAVRILRIKNYFRNISTLKLEKKIGKIIHEKTRAKVNLNNPEVVYFGIISEKFVFGKVLHEINRYQYEKRKPHLRPFFKPGVMIPRICRALVNLTRVKKGEKLLDPFCGTGGFLIEAGLIGVKVYGCDIDPRILHGCKKNLEHYGIRDYELWVGDARDLANILKFHDFDAVVTDPPYGISASTKGAKLEELYKEAIKAIHKVLKPEKFACIVMPDKIKGESFAEEVGFKIIERHFERVHRSLTRKILVLQKKKL